MSLPNLSRCALSFIVVVCLGSAAGLNSAAYSQSFLLTSIHGTHSGTISCESLQPVPNAVELFLQYNESQELRIGEGNFWFDGDTGTLDFHSQNTPNFDEFASYATNGTNDIFQHCSCISCPHGPPCEGFCSDDTEETQMGCPDLYGCQIDFISLVVNSTRITWDGYYTEYSISVSWEFWGQGICGCVNGVQDDRPTEVGLLLMPNSPNPFNPFTTITYSIPKVVLVNLRVYDVHGRLVRTLVSEPKTAREHSVRWDSRDNKGSLAASGVYFVRLEAGGQVVTRKIVLMK